MDGLIDMIEKAHPGTLVMSNITHIHNIYIIVHIIIHIYNMLYHETMSGSWLYCLMGFNFK